MLWDTKALFHDIFTPERLRFQGIYTFSCVSVFFLKVDFQCLNPLKSEECKIEHTVGFFYFQELINKVMDLVELVRSHLEGSLTPMERY